MSSPYLPPETLLQIFESIDSPIDLLSCCLVQPLWCDCVLPRIETTLENYYVHTGDVLEFHRKANLFAEAAKSEPRIVRLVHKVFLDLSHIYSRDETDDDEALKLSLSDKTAFTLALFPSLHDIEISWPNYSFNYLQLASKTFFEKLSPLRHSLTSIKFEQWNHEKSTIPSTEDMQAIADFLSTLVELESINLHNFTGGISVAQALSKLPKIKTASFRGVTFSDKDPFRTVFTSWPHLRQLQLRIDDPETFTQSLIALQEASPPLQELQLVCPRLENDDYATSISNLVYNLVEALSPYLKVLSITRFNCLKGPAFLSLLARSIPNIVHLELNGCRQITTEDVPTPEWPRLTKLGLAKCKGLTSTFFLGLISASEELNEVHLTRPLRRDIDVKTELERKGFNGKWINRMWKLENVSGMVYRK